MIFFWVSWLLPLGLAQPFSLSKPVLVSPARWPCSHSVRLYVSTGPSKPAKLPRLSGCQSCQRTALCCWSSDGQRNQVHTHPHAKNLPVERPISWPEQFQLSPRTSSDIDTLYMSQMRRRVLTVIGLPASICCQWRAEKPNEIRSSWL